MKIIRFKKKIYQPASHEKTTDPGVLKKILLTHNDLSKGQVQIINWAKLPVGKIFRKHYHEDMEEIFIIISGKAKITIEEQTDILDKGDVILIPVKFQHQMENIGKIDVKYIVIGISQGKNGKTVVV